RLPKRVALIRVGDTVPVELADKPLDLRVLFRVEPVILRDDRIPWLIGPNRGFKVRDERGVGQLRLAEYDVARLQWSLPRTVCRAAMPSGSRYCRTSRRPNLDAPSSRSRKVYGTSMIFFAFARAITSSPILKPIAFRCTPSRAMRRTAKKPLVASRTG